MSKAIYDYDITAEREREAQVIGATQASADINIRLRDEFMRRELSTDKFPKGYRKMTNDELVQKVTGEYSMQKLAALNNSQEEALEK